MLTINTNIMSMNAQSNMAKTQASLAQATQRLSSGLRINSAKDDAAGLSIASSMETNIRSMNVGMRNANDAISLVQTADEGLASTSGILQRMRELAVEASNSTRSTEDLAILDKEYQALNTQLGEVAKSVKFNKLAMIAGDAGTFSFQIGPNAGDTVSVTTQDATGYLATPGDITSGANAATALTAIDTALTSVSTDRATYGGTLNTLESTMSNLSTSIQNQSAARSRIMDADFAAESANLLKAQIMQQVGTAMLAQANQTPQMVLSLLR